jgi:hypothetical protein
MPSKNPFTRKLHDLRYLYGAAAAWYFRQHPVCEHCGEKRIAVLTLHHLYGKAVNIFRTLCFNCHMAVHSDSPAYTNQDYLDHLRAAKDDQDARDIRKIRILKSREDGLSLRAIGVIEKISHVRVGHILRETN